MSSVARWSKSRSLAARSRERRSRRSRDALEPGHASESNRSCAPAVVVDRRPGRELVPRVARRMSPGVEAVETHMDEGIRQKILSLLDQHRIMTIATLRPDGWPQATTVGYAS